MIRKVAVPAQVKQAVRGNAGVRDLGKGASLGDWREVSSGHAPRFGPRELIGSGVTRPGRWKAVDPLRTPALPRRHQVLGAAIWAGVTGVAAWRAWKRHGGVSGARAELRGEARGS